LILLEAFSDSPPNPPPQRGVMKKILSLLNQLEPLVKKQAQKEKDKEPKVFTELLKEIQFFGPEIEDLLKQESQSTD
jgi:hypothetical protein